MDLIVGFFKRHWPQKANAPMTVAAVALAAALAVAFVSLWVAKITGVSYGFLRLVEAVLSPGVVMVGATIGGVVWFVLRYDSELREFFRNVDELQVMGNKFKLNRSRKETAEDKKANEGEEKTLVEIQRKAESEDGYFQNLLGWKYEHGDGVTPNYEKAVEWYRRAAAGGYDVAQFNLGLAYDYGKGVPLNHAEAVKWWRRAAKQGYPPAQFNLGVSYREGSGVRKSNAQAAKWWRYAAEQGLADAQFSLAVLYSKGEGVPRSARDAYVWYALAATSGDADAEENKERIAERLSADDLEKAQNEAARLSGKISRWEVE